MDLYRGTVGKRDRRTFLADPLEPETIRRILQAGRMTPTSSNSEHNRFIAIQDPAVRQAIADLSPLSKWLARAPLVIVIVQVKDHPFDAGRAAQNMMLAAYNDGIGSCPAHVSEEKLTELLGIPSDIIVNRVIGFGKIDPERAGPPPAVARKRKPIEELVHIDRW